LRTKTTENLRRKSDRSTMAIVVQTAKNIVEQIRPDIYTRKMNGEPSAHISFFGTVVPQCPLNEPPTKFTVATNQLKVSPPARKE